MRSTINVASVLRSKLFLTFALVSVTVICLYSSYYWKHIQRQMCPIKKNNVNSEDVIRDYMIIARLIAEAHRKSRDIEAIMPLQQALQYMNNDVLSTVGKQLRPFHLNLSNEYAERVNKRITSEDVCKEEFKQFNEYYDLGWERPKKCPEVTKPLHELVTILIDAQSFTKLDDINSLLRDVHKEFPDFPVIIATSLTISKHNISKLQVLRQIGLNWPALVSASSTKYILLARNVSRVSNYTKIDRLVDVLSSLEIAVVGGAIRSDDGKFRIGCYQTKLKNYTLTYNEGYDFSTWSCQYCDYFHGPFLAKTSFLRKQVSKLQSNIKPGIKNANFFHYLFLNLNQDREVSMVCPDSMFHVMDVYPPDNKEQWIPLAKDFSINRIVSYGGNDFSFTCEETGTQCGSFIGNYKGLAQPICCLKKLLHCMKALERLTVENGIVMEIRFGSRLSALKFQTVLPWDIDADFHFWEGNYSAMGSVVGPKLKEQGCSLYKSVYGYGLGISDWFMDVTRDSTLPSMHWLPRGFKQTKVLVDGMWFRTSPSPGLAARNEYGKEIYKHVSHHRHRDESMSIPYVPDSQGHFKKCPKPGFHACLDQYYADGSFQFH